MRSCPTAVVLAKRVLKYYRIPEWADAAVQAALKVRFEYIPVERDSAIDWIGS